MVERVVRAVAAHRALVERVASAAGLEVPAGIIARVTARASGPMILHDDKQLTELKPLMSLAESIPEWSVEVASEWAKPWGAVVTRVLNRALAQFRTKKGSLPIQSGVECIKIDERLLGELVARVEGESFP